jgi:hypothetical protein
VPLTPAPPCPEGPQPPPTRPNHTHGHTPAAASERSERTRQQASARAGNHTHGHTPLNRLAPGAVSERSERARQQASARDDGGGAASARNNMRRTRQRATEGCGPQARAPTERARNYAKCSAGAPRSTTVIVPAARKGPNGRADFRSRMRNAMSASPITEP